MAKITKEQMKDTFFRTMLLSDKMDELEDIVSGMGKELGITDDSGRTDPEKLDALISGLIDSFKHCLELEGRTLEEWEEKMYSSFLYCAMQMTRIKENRRRPEMTHSHLPHTFRDIVDAAKDVITNDDSSIASYLDFMTTIYTPYFAHKIMPFYRIPRTHTIIEGDSKTVKHIGPNDDPYDPERVHRRSKFCSVLSNDLLSSNYHLDLMVFTPPSDIRARICKEFAKKHNMSPEIFFDMTDDPLENGISYYYYVEREENDLRLLQEEFQRELEAGDPEAVAWQKKQDEKKKAFEALKTLDDLAAYKENEVLKDYSFDEIRALNEEMLQCTGGVSDRDRSRFVASDKELKKHFNEFLQLYYDHKHESFYSDVANMVEAYLIEHKLSAFSLGDDYGLIVYQLNKACKRISAEIERVSN